MIHSINSSRGINTIFIAQILNPKKLIDPDIIYGWLPNVFDSDVWPLQKRFNFFVGELSKELGVGFIYPDISLFTDEHFEGNGHFSDVGSNLFSEIIRDEVVKLCEKQ